MHNAVRILMLSCLCGLSWAAHAQIIICKDASGRTLTSDRPIPECADRAQRHMDRNGIVRREIAAPLTPEQKKERLAAEQRAKAEAVIEEEKKQNDRALLARFAHEKDIDVARKRLIDPVQDQIRRETAALVAAEKVLAAAQADGDRHKDKPTLPPAIQKRIEDAQKSVKDSRILIEQRELEIVQLGTRFDTTLVRFRQLKAADAVVAR
ncbi:MAG: DUF4124 domain-containing protein [Herminiimonas sp.]|nr:DUF4124 domain-containing protein [Herminiimonas sp.]